MSGPDVNSQAAAGGEKISELFLSAARTVSLAIEHALSSSSTLNQRTAAAKMFAAIADYSSALLLELHAEINRGPLNTAYEAPAGRGFLGLMDQMIERVGDDIEAVFSKIAEAYKHASRDHTVRVAPDIAHAIGDSSGVVEIQLIARELVAARQRFSVAMAAVGLEAVEATNEPQLTGLRRVEDLGLRPDQANIVMVHERGVNDIGELWHLFIPRLVEGLSVREGNIRIIYGLENAARLLNQNGEDAIHILFLHLSSVRPPNEYDDKARKAIESMPTRPLIITYASYDFGEVRPLFADDLVGIKLDAPFDTDTVLNFIGKRMDWPVVNRAGAVPRLVVETAGPHPV